MSNSKFIERFITPCFIKLALAGFMLLACVNGAAAQVVPYYDWAGADHSKKSIELIAQGFKLTSLSVYGNPMDPRVAAVWIKRPGPQPFTFYGYTLQDYKNLLVTQIANRYYPVLVSAVGSGAAARFSGSFEQDTGTKGEIPYRVTYQIGVGSMPFTADEMRKAGYLPRSVSVYGDPATPYFAATWQKNTRSVAWDIAGLNEDISVYQNRVEAQIAQWARPYCFALSASQRYISVFRDDQIGDFVARHNLDRATMDAEYTKWMAQGFYPSCLQGGGSGANTRFAVIFVKQENPIARKMTITGREVPALAKFDQEMTNTLKQNKARAASLAIAKDGRLVFARSYTWAEPGYPVTTPMNSFRIASCSKPLTAIAIFQLMDRKQIKFFTSVKDLQGFAQLPNSQSIPNTFQQVTVDQLLSHRTSWGDVQQDEAASAFLKTPLPINKYSLAAYNLSQGVPQTQTFGYSNFGYSILGMLIEKVTGMSYYQYVKTQILAPLGITSARLAKPLWSQRSNLQVRYHDEYLRVQKSRADGSGKLLPLPYGGENLTAFDSFGGWEMSATEYVRVLAELSKKSQCSLLKDNYNTMFSRPPTGYNDTTKKSEIGYGWGWWYQPLGDTPFGKSVNTYSHGGYLPGAQSWICHRTDGLDIVVFYNGENTRPDLNAIANSIPAANWPTHDLFSDTGIN